MGKLKREIKRKTRDITYSPERPGGGQNTEKIRYTRDFLEEREESRPCKKENEGPSPPQDTGAAEDLKKAGGQRKWRKKPNKTGKTAKG